MGSLWSKYYQKLLSSSPQALKLDIKPLNGLIFTFSLINFSAFGQSAAFQKTSLQEEKYPIDEEQPLNFLTSPQLIFFSI